MIFYMLYIFFFSYPWTWHLMILPLLVNAIAAYFLSQYIYKYIDVKDRKFLKYYLIFLIIIIILAILWDRFGMVIDIWN